MLLVWSIATPNGLRAAINNNDWSVKFLKYYNNEAEHKFNVPIPPSSHAHANLFLASDAIKQNNYQFALDTLKPMLTDPKTLTLDAYAGILYMTGRFDEALDTWIMVGDDNKLNRFASSMYPVGRPDLEIKAYEKLNEMNPEKYTNLLAVIMRNHNEYDRALQVLETGLKSRPQSPNRISWYRTMADIYIRKQSWQQAEAAYKQALSESPNDYDTWSSLGLLYMGENKNLDQAKLCFEKMIEINPSDSYGYLLLGKCYEELGQPEHALQAYRDAQSLDPDDSSVQQAIDRLSAP